mgnify:CR=1 FL=1
MSPSPEALQFRWRLLAALIAGLLWAASVPPLDGGLLPAVLLFPFLLLSLDGTTWKEGLLVGLFFACTALAIGCFWVYNVFGLIGFLLIPIVSLNQIVFAAGARLLLQQTKCNRFLEVAIWWTAIEFFRSEWAPLSNATMTIGGTVPTGFLMYPARYVGVYGLTFLAALLGCLIYRIYCYHRESKSVSKAFVFPLLLIVLWSAIGFLSAPKEESKKSFTALAVQGERVPLDRFITNSEKGLRKVGKVDMVVWPEWALRGVFFEEEKKIQAKLAAFVKKHGVYLVFGNKRRAPGDFYNTVFVLSPQGEQLGYASKSRPVPFLGDGTPTKNPAVVSTSLGKLGLPICYDADFSTVVLGHVARGAQCLIIPTCDNKHWGWFQHMQRARLLRLRGVETGRFILRVNTSGPSLIVAPDGTYREALWSGEEEHLLVKVELLNELTPYVQGGWIFGPICLFISLLTVGAALRRIPAGNN